MLVIVGRQQSRGDIACTYIYIYAYVCAEAYLQPRFTPGSLEESKLSIQHRNQILVKLLVEIISLLLAHVSRNTLGGLPRVTEYFATMRAIVLHGWRFATRLLGRDS